MFSGRVQGVGFRYTACRVAADYPVTGYVRNLPDGRVELVAEGAPSALEQFLRRLTGRMGGFIRETQAEQSPANGEFDSFEVRF
ncbi:MAG: Acylphosphatase [Phycisphaerae bacterium]|nr:Acylphosphatase [Phycisphaerae bacterium]